MTSKLLELASLIRITCYALLLNDEEQLRVAVLVDETLTLFALVEMTTGALANVFPPLASLITRMIMIPKIIVKKSVK